MRIWLIKLKIICILTWWIYRKKEHWCFWRTIKGRIDMLIGSGHEIGLVSWFIVELLVFLEVMMD